MVKRTLFWLVVLVVVWLIVSCEPLQLATPQSEPTAISQSSDSVDVQIIALDEQETTFLDAIETELDAAETAPNARMYVTLSGNDGAEWQGELHRGNEWDVYWLQQAESTGLTALRIEAPAGTGHEAILAALPAPEATGRAVDVQIDHIRAELNDDNTWSIGVTVQHPDVGWDDYTDGWQIETVEGEILGLRILLHPHTNEQPFTRSISGIVVPDGVSTVHIRPHDLVSGYGASVELPIAAAGEGPTYEVVR